jgi:hypothetical protein
MRRKLLVAWVDQAAFLASIFLLVVGLVFVASGFGIFVVGRLDGVVLIVMGFTRFWGGWTMSGARGVSCATAAVLNMFDAASTLSFWSYEANPLILAIGPTVFLVAKVVCSITIMLFAKVHPNPREGGVMLALFFSLIVAWNLGQHLLAYLGMRVVPYEAYFFIVGAALSFSVATFAVAILLLKKRI